MAPRILQSVLTFVGDTLFDFFTVAVVMLIIAFALIFEVARKLLGLLERTANRLLLLIALILWNIRNTRACRLVKDVSEALLATMRFKLGLLLIYMGMYPNGRPGYHYGDYYV